jgi:hypothetical protein
MQEKIDEPISVVMYYNQRKSLVAPYGFCWQGRNYRVKQVGYHHKLRQGNKLNHIYSVTDGQLAFRLKLDTDNLAWTLEEVSDGNSR